jgi:hypothetical protein
VNEFADFYTLGHFAGFFAQKTCNFSTYSSHIYDSEFFIIHGIFSYFSIDSTAQGGLSEDRGLAKFAEKSLQLSI